MKILIIGNDPHDIEGVANYTRPLALKFKELEHDVFYFYSGAWNRKYDWFIIPYLRIDKKDYPYECAEIINSPNWAYNYNNPLLDISSSSVEKLFVKYITKIQPDIMHVHSRLGLPASIIEIASRHEIKVFVTIHTYGFLCQKRVMIDNNGLLCSGPLDLEKCARCVEHINIKRLKFDARISKMREGLLKSAFFSMERIYDKLIYNRQKINKKAVLNYEKIADQLQKRLDYMIKLMNEHVIANICVSSDVKKTLMKYGVQEEKLLVQHIGSKIAENQKREEHHLHNPIVVGNIGGVGYYKGIHILIDAIIRLKRTDFSVKVFGKYDDLYVTDIMRGKEHLPVEFLGRYEYEQLPEILSQIDIMVLPSICNDTAPQTIFESFSFGIPIIASDIGGFPDFIRDGINGYLFRPGDSQDLASKIESILNDPEKISYFSSNIPKLKTIAENAMELFSLYKETVK